MDEKNGFDRFLSFIKIQLRNGNSSGAPARPRAVTISRQAGCGAQKVAETLARLLESSMPKGSAPWTVFDRNLVEKVLEDHQLPHGLARFMPENRISEIQDILDELFGLHPPSWLLVRQTAETILHLASVGNVIIIGRGGNVITAGLDGVFHVRLVASLDRRVEQIQRRDGLRREAALQFIRQEDTGRQRYLRKYYHTDINDPLLYHVVINTDLVAYEKAARLIADAALIGVSTHTDHKHGAMGRELELPR